MTAAITTIEKDGQVFKVAELGKICRTCLVVSDDLRSGLDINEKTGMKPLQALMLFTSTPIFENEGMSFPTNICKDCYESIERIILFKRLVEESYDILQNLSVRVVRKTLSLQAIAKQQLNQNEQIIATTISEAEFTKNTNLQETPEEASALKKKSHTCGKCNSSFFTMQNLIRHLKLHKKNPLFCKKCNKSFKSQNDLYIHRRNHIIRKKLTCKHCGLRFLKSNAYNRHLEHHNTYELNECQTCKEKFYTPGELFEHTKTHTINAKGKLFTCDTCGKSCNTLNQLKVHSRVHTGETPHSCKDCNKYFKHSDSLKQHNIKEHSNDKPFECDTDTRKYICNICSCGFKIKSSFLLHMKKHKKNI